IRDRGSAVGWAPGWRGRMLGAFFLPRGALLLLRASVVTHFRHSSNENPEGTPAFQAVSAGLFRDHSPRCGAGRLLRRRDHECHPGVPSVGPILVGEFPVAFDIEITCISVVRGMMNPSCGPTPTTRDWKQPTRSPEPLSHPTSW